MDSQKKILVIDDEVDVVTVVSLRLKANGYSVSEAFTVEEGFKKIKEDKPDLILLDVLLPDGDGYQVCQKLKSEPETKDITIIIFTASSQRDLAKKAMEVGAVDFILKPFEAKDLLEKINRVLK